MSILYGISVGPGDPELITVKALHILQKVSVVAFPAGTDNKPGMAESIASKWLNPQQICLPLKFPYVRDTTVLTKSWHQCATEVWHYLKQGLDVAFLCEGDVSFYSTFTYLSQTLQHLYADVTVEALPGICSPMAACSALGIPLVTGGQRLVVLPAIYNITELESALKMADVLVLMKVASVYEQVWQVLQQRQLLNRTWVVERATHSDQRIYNELQDYPNLKLPYFSVMIVQVSPSEELAAIKATI